MIQSLPRIYTDELVPNAVQKKLFTTQIFIA